MIQSEYSYMTNLALFSAQELSGSRQTFYSFVWVRLQTPSSYRSPAPGAVVFPRAVAQCEWEVLSLTLC